MNCPKCGSTMTNEDRFCGRCGTGLTSLSGHRADGSTPQGVVSFSDAVKLGFQGYFKFNGRSTRAEFWWWQLFLLITGIMGALIDVAIGNDYFTSIFFFGILIPSWAVLVRRLHDTNKTGWWILIMFIPFAGIVLFVFIVQGSNMGTNEYGPNPREAISQ